jgi:F0F1-type ATP synthase alpha subunit
VAIDSIREWEADLVLYMKAHYPGLRKTIMETADLTDADENVLIQALTEFASSWTSKH